MEKFAPENKTENDRMKKLRNFATIAGLAVTSFLASCEGGPKTQATTNEIENFKNKIENAEYVSPAAIKKLKDIIKEEKDVENDPIMEREITEFYSAQEDDSTISFHAVLVGEGDVDLAINKKNNMLVHLCQHYFDPDTQKEVADIMYVVANDGSIVQKNYDKGYAENLITSANR